MKAFRRFLLLATFAAMGLGLALWVVISTDCTGINSNPTPNLSVCVAVPRDLPAASTWHKSIRQGKGSASTGSTLVGELPAAVRGESAMPRPYPAIAARLAATELPMVPPTTNNSQVSGPELIAPQPATLVALANIQHGFSRKALVSSRAELIERTPPIVGRSPAVPGGPELAKGPEISNWMLDDLKHEGPLPPVAAPSYPFDPGQSGTNRNIVRPSPLP